MTTKTTKLIRTIYLYVAALISLIFVAVGSGNIINTTLKAYVFPEAEKGGYGMCTNQPPIYEIAPAQSLEKAKNSDITTVDQKQQIESLLADYKTWKENNAGDICFKRERARNYVDSFTMLLIALPICLIHWRIIKKDKEEKEEEVI
jgi:hypothetical protein